MPSNNASAASEKKIKNSFQSIKNYATIQALKQTSKENKMTAHYFATKTVKFVIISKNSEPVGDKIEVKGRVEARKIAKQYNATCWNF